MYQNRDMTQDTRPDSLIAGRYRLQRQLARGGQATVFLATQEPLGRSVALKVLAPHHHDDPDTRRMFVQRFLFEAQTMASLHHPSIAVIHDYGQTAGGELYIAMEYIPGRPILDVLRAPPIDIDRVLALTLSVCEALAFAHRRGVIHRDVKNSNILVTANDQGQAQVKVLDFGIAKLVSDEPSLTLTGTVLGSPHFMAPEQARGESVDHRADIYAVGVLMFCALAGRYPFEGSSPPTVLAAALTQQAPSFDSIPGAMVIPGALESVIRRCLQREPADRFADMPGVISALRTLLGDRAPSIPALTLTPPDTETGTLIDPRTLVDPPPAPRDTGNTIALVGAGVAVVFATASAAVLIAAVFLFLAARSPPTSENTPAVPDAPVVAGPAQVKPSADPPPPLEPPTEQAPAAAAPRAAPAQPRASTAPPAPEEPATAAPTPAPEPTSDADEFSIGSSDLRDPWSD